MIVKCIVAGHGGDGPDLFFVKVDCTKEQYADGDHYGIAQNAAEENGYEGPFVVFDEDDGAGKHLLPLFQWETADIWSADGKIKHGFDS